MQTPGVNQQVTGDWRRAERPPDENKHRQQETDKNGPASEETRARDAS